MTQAKRDPGARRMGENELFSEAPELGVVLANYHEVRIRHFHQTIDKYISGQL